MKKKIRLILIILLGLYLTYFVGLIIYRSIQYLSKDNARDFSYIEKTTEIHEHDSLYFSNIKNPDIKVLYTSKFKNSGYLSLFEYKNKYRFLIRQLRAQHSDLLKTYKPIFEKIKEDVLVKYDMEEMHPFIYKIDVERKSTGDVKNLIIDGEDIALLKHTKDSILFHGKIYTCWMGNEGNIKEGLYMENETFWRNPVDVEWLIMNQKDGLYEYVLFSMDGQQVPVGILGSLLKELQPKDRKQN